MTSDAPAQTDRPAPVAGLLSLVVPVFNERESLAKLLAEIDAAAKGLTGKRVEVVFVDDGSTDGSWDEIRTLATADTRVRGVRFRRNFGKAAALEAGFRTTTGEIVFTLDADLQDDPAEIPRFLEALNTGLDVVSGYKQVRHDPWHKVFPSRVFNRMVSTVTGVHLHDHNCGFKAYRAAVVRSVRLYGELHRYVPVLAAAKGYRSGEIVVHHRPRQFGKSKFGWKRFLKGFLDLLQVRFVTAFGWRPMHFFGTLGVIALALAGVSLAGLVLLTLCGPVGSFWSAVLLLLGLTVVLAGGFAGQCVLTGFVAELLAARRTDDPFEVSETTPERVP